jgi:cytochrome P450/NADPH-cytochrome P450 reductase
MAGDGLFTAHSDEPNWGCAHRILMPAFSQRAMKAYFDVMLRVANRLVDKWDRQGPDADIAVADDMTRLTLDTIALAGFGYDFASFASDELDPFVVAMVGALGRRCRSSRACRSRIASWAARIARPPRTSHTCAIWSMT